jgi:hypothetical protein
VATGLIIIECDKASLISDKNLILSVNGTLSITFSAQQKSSSAVSAFAASFSASSFSAASFVSEGFYEKNLPSFSITFYRDFQNGEFIDRFDSYKDRQIISSNSSLQDQTVPVFVKVISHFSDELAVGTVNQNYKLAIYSDFYTNPDNTRYAALTKVINTPEGSVYFSSLSFTTANYINFFDGKVTDDQLKSIKTHFDNKLIQKLNIKCLSILKI